MIFLMDFSPSLNGLEQTLLLRNTAAIGAERTQAVYTVLLKYASLILRVLNECSSERQARFTLLFVQQKTDPPGSHGPGGSVFCCTSG
jgi:hypothetical protein